jgi:hypothetical protein
MTDNENPYLEYLVILAFFLAPVFLVCGLAKRAWMVIK